MDRLVGNRFVSGSKVTDYLLNEAHPSGAAKATYFQQFGFTIDHPNTLVLALEAHPELNAVVKVEVGPFGLKHIVECSLATPDGRNPCIRTIWLLENSTTIHRLITAYPT